jgi:hypothetical protein
MLAVPNRQEVEALTYYEVLAILREVDLRERRLRDWDVARTTQTPYETFDRMQEATDDALAEALGIDETPVDDATAAWLKAR